MANSDKVPERSVSGLSQRSDKTAAIVGCSMSEGEEIELLLDLLQWSVVRLDSVRQLSKSGAALAFVDSNQIEFSKPESVAHIFSAAPVIGVLCDASEMATIKAILTLDSHILVRPIDLEAVESVIRIAT
jgi:hypothetical protein